MPESRSLSHGKEQHERVSERRGFPLDNFRLVLIWSRKQTLSSSRLGVGDARSSFTSSVSDGHSRYFEGYPSF